MGRDNFPASRGRCTCGKMAFLSRRDARKAMKATYPGEGMQVYHCRHYVEFHWHFGHPYRRGQGIERAQRADREGRDDGLHDTG